MRKKIGTVGYSADRQAGVQPDEVSYATTINALTKARSLLRQIKGKHSRTAFQTSKHLVGLFLGDFPMRAWCFLFSQFGKANMVDEAIDMLVRMEARPVEWRGLRGWHYKGC